MFNYIVEKNCTMQIDDEMTQSSVFPDNFKIPWAQIQLKYWEHRVTAFAWRGGWVDAGEVALEAGPNLESFDREST